MGFRAVALFIAPLLLAAPALAQQEEARNPVFNLPRAAQPQTEPNRQGPELDVFRGAPSTVTPPPVAAPTIVPPPPVIAAPQQAAPAVPQQQQRPATRTPPAEPVPTSDAAPAEPAPVPAPAPAPAATAEPPTKPIPEPTLQAVPDRAEPPLVPAGEGAPWGWIAAGVAAIAAILAAIWLLRRRNRLTDDADGEPLAEQRAEQQAGPAADPVAPPAPRPSPPRPAPAPAPASTSRPQIDLSMEVRGARLSLMGATIQYMLTIRNSGSRAAEDVLIRSLIANADAAQQGALQQFFAGQLGLPTHSVVSVAPGEAARLTGELRLMPDQIAAVEMGGRSLLIPIIAFDAQYRWDEAGDHPAGTGRAGRAFIVGQEKSPPAEQLAPFRLDMGPRQYRAPGSRATDLKLAS